MNLAPIYELRSRLRASMIAGAGLLSEDFRLKRAVEEIRPLETLNPVFAKIGQLANALVTEGNDNKESILMDTITLVDALLCTQGTVAVTDEIDSIEVSRCGSVVNNAPYSVVKGLTEALTTSGNGHYQFVVDTHEEQPQLFADYRVKSAMVEALGAGYAELADLVAGWLKADGEEILPLLQKGFDPKGKKEMLRRLQVIQAIAGGKANDFYKNMLPQAERDIRNELILALRHNQDNVELLQELIKTQKGKAKKMAYYALAEMEDERAEKVFRDMNEKNPIDTMIYLRMTTTKWACKMVGESLINKLSICRDPDYGKGEKVFDGGTDGTEHLRMIIEALIGKNGPEICEAYRMAFEVSDIYYSHIKDKKIQTWRMHIPVRRMDYHKFEHKGLTEAMVFFLDTSIRLNPSDDLCELAMELYQAASMKNKEQIYFRAAVLAKLMGKEDCSEWLREQLYEKGLVKEKKRKDMAESLELALKGLIYDKERKGYYLQTKIKDDANEVYETFERPVTQEINGAFMDVLIEYCSESVDKQIIHLVNKDNEACRKKLEEYFCKRALTGPHDRLTYYWKGLKECGYESCEGMLTEYIKRYNGRSELSGWDVYSRLWELPGTAESIEKEAMVVLDMINTGKVKVRLWNENHFCEYLENVLAKRRKGY